MEGPKEDNGGAPRNKHGNQAGSKQQVVAPTVGGFVRLRGLRQFNDALYNGLWHLYKHQEGGKAQYSLEKRRGGGGCHRAGRRIAGIVSIHCTARGAH